MTDTIMIITLVVASVCCGMIVGRLAGGSLIKDKLDRAYRKAKEESEVEKANLSIHLGEQLAIIRESIVKSAEAYQSAVNAIEEKLSIRGELMKFSDGTPIAKQLSLDFTKIEMINSNGTSTHGQHNKKIEETA